MPDYRARVLLVGIFSAFFLCLPLSQELTPESTQTSALLSAPDPRAIIERNVMLENFETATGFRKKWSLNYKKDAGLRGYLIRSSLEDPPVQKSRYYLFASLRGRGVMGATIRARPPIQIKGFVVRLELWVYGYGESVRLFVDLQDQSGQNFREFIGPLSFSGWRKLIIEPGSHIIQRPLQLRGDAGGIRLLGFFLKPDRGTTTRVVRLQMDEIQATVRDYMRNPSFRWSY